MGTGCARGFLASFDATWMIKQWSLKREEGLGEQSRRVLTKQVMRKDFLALDNSALKSF